MDAKPTTTRDDNYSLFQSLEPRLWTIILDVILTDAENNDQFEAAFYPILQTFPDICCCDDNAPVKQHWISHLNRVMAIVSGVPLRVYAMAAALGDNMYDERMAHPRDIIEEDARRFNADMATGRHLRPKAKVNRERELYNYRSEESPTDSQTATKKRRTRAQPFIKNPSK